MMIKIKEYCFKIASWWGIGYWVFGWLVAALLALPFLFFFRILGMASPLLQCIGECSFFFIVFAAIYGALRIESDAHPGVIVINNTFGLVLALFHLPLTIKFTVVGLILFYLLKYFVPLSLVQVFELDIDRLPALVVIIGGDTLAGVLVNVFLRFVLWLTC